MFYFVKNVDFDNKIAFQLGKFQGPNRYGDDKKDLRMAIIN